MNPEPLLTRSLLFCQPLGIHACAAETFGAAPLGRPGILPGLFCQPLGIRACAAETFGAAPLGIPGILPGLFCQPLGVLPGAAGARANLHRLLPRLLRHVVNP